MRRLLIVMAFVGLLCPAFSQNFDLEKERMPLAEIQGQFRFHAGDDPRWADPSFDDSSWSLLRSDESWFSQGYKKYAGVGWYRFRVDVPAELKDLAILLPLVNDSYQIFANGRLLGQVGEMPPHGAVFNHNNNIFYIPAAVVTPGHPLVFAVRAWGAPLFAAFPEGGFGAPPVVGDAAAVTRWRDLQIRDRYWRLSSTELLMLANILGMAIGLALFAVRPAEREYLWFGAAQFFWSLNSVVGMATRFMTVPYIPFEFLTALGFFGGAVLNIEFFHALLRQRRGSLYWIGAVPVLFIMPVLGMTLAGWVSFNQFGAVETGAFLPYAAVVAILLFRAGINGNMEARVLFVPFSVSCLSIFLFDLLDLIDLSRHPLLLAMANRYSRLFTWPINMGGGNLTGMACLGSVCVVLILRFARSRRDEERLTAELEAARAVQHVLIPDELPSVPGVEIESVYKPAGQVGGDFFQIIPRSKGGALIAIGDVSGKGMPAAMTVSLLVGTFRTLVHYTESPAEILKAMNLRMLSRSQGGFTTCLVLKLDLDGALTIANAGHIAPYVGGCEVETANGLPLGLSVDAEYGETTIRLSLDDHLTLLTDGVVEARDPRGELFGFERARHLSTKAAAIVASTAQSFGQEDDITVLTLHLSPMENVAG